MEKHLVVQGAACMCDFGTIPDNLMVLTHNREYANDKDSAKKLIASTKDIGLTFQKNTFGPCAKQLKKPCTAVITEWINVYEKVTLTNGGKILLEDSKATCPIGGSGCIRIVQHGQTAEVSSQHLKKADPKVQRALNPAAGNVQKESGDMILETVCD